MAFNTMSAVKPKSIFDVGSFLSRIGNIAGDLAVDTFAKVAPVWTANQFNLDQELIKPQPTFQQTQSEQLRDARLTTQPVQPNPTTPGITSVQAVAPDRSGGTLFGNVNQTTVLLIGAGILGAILLIPNRG